MSNLKPAQLYGFSAFAVIEDWFSQMQVRLQDWRSDELRKTEQPHPNQTIHKRWTRSLHRRRCSRKATQRNAELMVFMNEDSQQLGRVVDEDSTMATIFLARRHLMHQTHLFDLISRFAMTYMRCHLEGGRHLKTQLQARKCLLSRSKRASKASN